MKSTELSKKIKVINKRYVDIVKKWGEDSQIANKMRNIMQVLPHRTTKSGYISIRNLSTMDNDDNRLINKLSTFQTQGQYTKKIEKDYKEYLQAWFESGMQGALPNYREGLKQFEKVSGQIHDTIMNYKDAIYEVSPKVTSYLRKSGRMSWSEVFEFEQMVLEIHNKNLMNPTNRMNYLANKVNERRILSEIIDDANNKVD